MLLEAISISCLFEHFAFDIDLLEFLVFSKISAVRDHGGVIKNPNRWIRRDVLITIQRVCRLWKSMRTPNHFNLQRIGGVIQSLVAVMPFVFVAI